MRRLWIAVLISAVLAFAGDAYAEEEPGMEAEPTAEVDESTALEDLREEVQGLNERLDEMEESKQDALDDRILNWLSRWTFKGDFRLRYENIDVEGRSHRNRGRIRLRVGAEAEVTDDWKVTFILATGGEDPGSTNQTLDDGFSTKDIRLDVASLQWHALKEDEHGADVRFEAGKMKNPFSTATKSELIWDGDLRPEGVVAKVETGAGIADLWLTVGGFYVDERSGDADTSLWGAQTGVRLPIASEVTLGVGYYDFGNVEGEEPLFGDSFFQNSTTLVPADMDDDGLIDPGEGFDVYKRDYDLFEAFAQYRTDVEGIPCYLYADWVKNTSTGNQSKGYSIGTRVGKVKKRWDWEFRYIWKRLQKDAVLGLFADSDFSGGGTDIRGHEVGGGLGLAKNVKLEVSYFHGKGKFSEPDRLQYDRLIIDLGVKF